MTERKGNAIGKVRRSLVRQRMELIDKIDMSLRHGSATNAPDENDAASYTAEESLALSLATMETATLYEIDLALGRIDAGEYGTCEGCGKGINPERLKALPHATLCIGCKELDEQGLL